MSIVGNMVTLNTARFGQYMFTKGTNVNLRSEPQTSARVIANVAASGTPIGKSSGVYSYNEVNCGEEWYQFVGSNYGTGWIRGDLAAFSTSPNAPPSTSIPSPSAPSSSTPTTSTTVSLPISQASGSNSNLLMYALIAGAALLFVPKLLDMIDGNQKSKIKNRK